MNAIWDAVKNKAPELLGELRRISDAARSGD